MKTRLAAVLLASLLILVASLLINGCQRSAATGAAGEGATDQNALVLEQLKQFQVDTGKNMAQLMDQLNRQQSLQAEKAGDPPLVRDLATAQGAHRTAQTVLAAARNRLRILGKGDDEIAALERSPDSRVMKADAVVTAPIGGTVVTRQVGIGQYITSPDGKLRNMKVKITGIHFIMAACAGSEEACGVNCCCRNIIEPMTSGST